MSKSIEKLSDKELYKICKEYGANARLWAKKFAALLPEVNKRKLYKKKGFYSIYEFAAKLAGMSNATVDEILKVHQKLEDKPVLKNMIGEHGWSKLKVVAHVATPETQEFWAEKVDEMSQATLKTFLKELKKENQSEQFTNSENIPLLRVNSGTPASSSQKSALTFKLDTETETKLRIFKQKLEKENKEPMEWNSVMKKLLEIAEQQESRLQTKNVPLKTIKKPEITVEQINEELPEISERYIPTKVKHYLKQKYKGKCAFPSCKHPSEILHHIKRFSLVQNHNPDYIVPLCKNHERLAHRGLIENEEKVPKYWKIRTQPDKTSPKYMIDQRVIQFRMKFAPI